MLEVKIQKVGHSLMLTLPQKLNIQLGFRKGTKLQASLVQNGVTFKELSKVRHKNITEIGGRLDIPNFDSKKMIALIKEGDYDR